MKFLHLFFISIFIILITLFLVHYLIVKQAVYGDGIYYYSITRSIYKDKDINFINELGHHYSWENNNSLKEEPLETAKTFTSTGYVPNKYSIGAPLFFLIGFSIADGISFINNLFNSQVSILGFSDIYQISVGIQNVLFIVLGISIIYRLLSKFYSKYVSILSLLTLLFGTNLLFYGSLDVINSHPFSFFLNSVFLSIFIEILEKSEISKWIFLGIVYGLLILTRLQDAIIGVLITIEGYMYFTKHMKNKKILFKRGISYVFFFLIAFILFTPQLFFWKIIYGTYIAFPYLSDSEGFNIINNNLIQLIFNIKNGLLWWSPLIILSFIGLILWKNKNLKFYFLIYFLIQCLLISSWSGWSQGESYGIRMLISTYPFLIFGIAEIIKKITERYSAKAAFSFCAIFILLNFISIFYFLVFSQSPTFDRGIETQKENLKFIQKIFY